MHKLFLFLLYSFLPSILLLLQEVFSPNPLRHFPHPLSLIHDVLHHYHHHPLHHPPRPSSPLNSLPLLPPSHTKTSASNLQGRQRRREPRPQCLVQRRHIRRHCRPLRPRPRLAQLHERLHGRTSRQHRLVERNGMRAQRQQWSTAGPDFRLLEKLCLPR